MARCWKCSDSGSIECPYCGGSGDFNRGGEIVECEACGKDGNSPGFICCTECDGDGDFDSDNL